MSVQSSVSTSGSNPSEQMHPFVPGAQSAKSPQTRSVPAQAPCPQMSSMVQSSESLQAKLLNGLVQPSVLLHTSSVQAFPSEHCP